jgi:hypothetical protein
MKTLKKLSLYFLIFCLSAPLAAAFPHNGPFQPSKESWDAARKLVATMSVDEKVGQLVHVGINARFANR